MQRAAQTIYRNCKIMNEANSRDWIAIRAAYEDRSVSVSDLCQRFRISKSRLYNRRRLESWPARRGHKTTDKKKSASRRQNMVTRFFETLERQMRDIERSFDDDTGAAETSAAGRERDARTLSSLVKTMEKLIELDTGADPVAAARKEAAHRDIDGLRRALADRIARLAGRRPD